MTLCINIKLVYTKFICILQSSSNARQFEHTWRVQDHQDEILTIDNQNMVKEFNSNFEKERTTESW